MEFTITEVERRTRKGLVPSLINPEWTAGQTGDKHGWYARVAVTMETDPELVTVYEVSKLDGETGWTVDATWAANGMPIHANGFGARYTLTKQVIAEVAARLDDMAGAAADALSGEAT